MWKSRNWCMDLLLIRSCYTLMRQVCIIICPRNCLLWLVGVDRTRLLRQIPIDSREEGEYTLLPPPWLRRRHYAHTWGVAVWAEQRRELVSIIGVDLMLPTIVRKMLDSIRNWIVIAACEALISRKGVVAWFRAESDHADILTGAWGGAGGNICVWRHPKRDRGVLIARRDADRVRAMARRDMVPKRVTRRATTHLNDCGPSNGDGKGIRWVMALRVFLAPHTLARPKGPCLL